MSQFNTARNLLHARIAYWGPAGAGKTSTLAALRRRLDPAGRMTLYRVGARDGKTLSFDLLPLDEFRLGTCRVRTRIVAGPGSADRAAARGALLDGADAVVFVADARRASLEADRKSLAELHAVLRSRSVDPASIPVVWAFNQHDLPGCVSDSALRELLGLGRGPAFDTVAIDGRGVFETFREVFRLMTRSLVERYAIVGADPDGVFPAAAMPQIARAGPLGSGERADRDFVIELAGSEEGALETQLRLVEAHIEADGINRKLEERNRELMAINRVGRSILSALEADNLLVVLLDATAEHLRSSHASCVLFDPSEAGKLRTHVLGFGRDPALGLQAEAARAFFELIHRSDGPIPVDETRNPEVLAALRGVDRRVVRVVFQPIKTKSGRPAGWIGIYVTSDQPPITTQELLFLSSISRLAALGLDKIALLDKAQRFQARLEQEVQQRTGELELANAKIRALNRGLEARVTERTRALEEANRKLKEARAGAIHAARLSGMGQLAASFAHEVNNPASGLQGNLSFMRESLDDLRAGIAAAAPQAAERLSALEEFEEILDESLAAAHRISAIVASLKRLGSEEDPSGELAINAVIADTVTLLEERISGCAELDLRLGNLPVMQGPAIEFGHVVLALLTNAIEAVERKGGRGHVTVTTFASAGKATLVVKDDGAGIEERLLPSVFEPFVSTKEGEPSAGLGLHCALKSVRRQGGSIRLRSRPNEGTTVTVEIPLRVAAPQPAEKDMVCDA